jgi:hypothetical protein
MRLERRADWSKQNASHVGYGWKFVYGSDATGKETILYTVILKCVINKTGNVRMT